MKKVIKTKIPKMQLKFNKLKINNKSKVITKLTCEFIKLDE